MWQIRYFLVSAFLPAVIFGINETFQKKEDDTAKCQVKMHNSSYYISVPPVKTLCRKPEGANEMEKILQELASLNKAFNFLDTRVTKMVENLSIRMLRWIRKIQSQLDTIENPQRMQQDEVIDGKPKQNCPEDFVGLDEWPSCYKFSGFNTTWHEAREYCSAFGANLVSMETVKEYYIVAFLIKNNPETAVTNGWWTAGNYIPRSRQWMWASQLHLKPFTFSKWGHSEPDADTMQCMLLFMPDNHRWHDEFCSAKYNFICEIDPLAKKED